MEINYLIELFNEKNPKEIEYNREEIVKILKEFDFHSNDYNPIIDRIISVLKITDNPRTRKSLITSYFRIFQEGIFKDGRNSSIVIEITKKCNKLCKHCYSDSHNKTKEMKDEKLNDIIKFARKEYKHIFITGGEPTLDPRLFKIAEKFTDIVFFVFTNGSVIHAQTGR